MDVLNEKKEKKSEVRGRLGFQYSYSHANGYARADSDKYSYSHANGNKLKYKETRLDRYYNCCNFAYSDRGFDYSLLHKNTPQNEGGTIMAKKTAYFTMWIKTSHNIIK